MKRSEIIILFSSVTVALLIGATSLLPASFYSSILWKCFWIIITLGLVLVIIKTKMWKKIPLFLLHLSFLSMIAGGFMTASLSRQGTIHIKPSQTIGSFIDTKGRSWTFPAEIALDSFMTVYYKGMSVPKDFRSEIVVSNGDTIHISMNHIGQLGNYRFYQTSFDDEGGSILTVNHDPWGIATVYFGFLLFAAAGGLIILIRSGITKRCCVLLMLILAGGGIQQASAVKAISGDVADSIALRQVMYNGSAVPFNTVATRLTYKLTGQKNVGGLSPEAFIASLIKYKEDWAKVPFIFIKSKTLQARLNIDGEYISPESLYRDGTYLPELIYEGGNGSLDNDIMALDEKMALLTDLWKGELFMPLSSDDPDIRTEASVWTEVIYNRTTPVRILFICSITLAAFILTALIFKRKIRIWPLITILETLGCLSFAWKWIVINRIPLNTTYELMEFTGMLTLMIVSYVYYKKQSELLAGTGLLCASFMYLVAWLGMKDPVMTPVLPVLSSPWLSVHVSLIMISYSILGFTMPTSLIALISPNQRKHLTSLSISLLIPGTYLMGLGIITGAMWANVSWGRYWAWDPKETWALVTLILYSIPLHNFFRFKKNPKTCNIYLTLAFLSVLMTYFGVNHLPSFHAYN